MSWNYRFVKHPDDTYGIHEVYYDDDGHPTGMTVDPICLGPFDYEEKDPRDAVLLELNNIMMGACKDIFIPPEHWEH